MKHIALALTMAAIPLLGCGEEDERDSKTADAAQVQALDSAIADVKTIGSVSESSDNAQMATGTLAGIFANYLTIMSTVYGEQQGEGLLQQAETATVPCASGSITWDSDAGTVTYDQCGDWSGVLDGTISWDGETFEIALTYEYSDTNGQYTGSFSYEGTITVTESSVDGGLSFTYEVNMTAMAFEYSIAVDIAYNEIGLDAQGCPSSGSLDISGDYDYTYQGDDYSYSVDITAEFAACDDVTIYY